MSAHKSMSPRLPSCAHTLNFTTEADRLQAQADALVRSMWSGDVDKSLPLASDLRSRLDYVIRYMSLQSIAAKLSPMEMAKARLAEILAKKGGSK